MSEVKWIKLATDIFDNRKIKQIERMPDGDSIIVIWFKLLCLAGNVNDGGLIYLTSDVPYTEEMLSTQFDKPLSTIRLALATFERFGMIEIVNDFLSLPSWEKYQNVEGMDKIREQTRQRVARHRESLKLESCNDTGNVTVTQCNATDKDIDIDKDIETPVVSKDTTAPKGARTFVPPTVEEVSEYCAERQNTVDAQTFVDFYESKGWLVGKAKMKDWKASVRTWERKRDGCREEKSATSNPFLRLLREGAFDDDE